MQALAIGEYGGPEQAQVQELPDPAPGQGEVLVRVRAAALNPLDVKIRNGAMRAMFHAPMPLVLGWDGAGVVERVGPDVQGFAVGDEVFGLMQRGALAELVVAPADGELAIKPRSLTWAQAAALPEAGLTALAILETSDVGAGDRVLIIGASGGIGSFLVPLARARGARVLATGDRTTAPLLRELGAEEVLDFRDGDPIAAARASGEVDVVVDLVHEGTDILASGDALKNGGVLVSTLFGPQPDAVADRTFELRYVRLSPSREGLDELGRLVDQDELKVQVVDTYPLARAAEAMAQLERGGVQGKLVVTAP